MKNGYIICIGFKRNVLGTFYITTNDYANLDWDADLSSKATDAFIFATRKAAEQFIKNYELLNGEAIEDAQICYCIDARTHDETL